MRPAKHSMAWTSPWRLGRTWCTRSSATREREDPDSSKIKPPVKFKGSNWRTWEMQAINFFHAMPTAKTHNLPLYNVIRPEDPPANRHTLPEEEQWIFDVTLQGRKYNDNKKCTYRFLCSWLADTPGRPWVKTFNLTEDGRGAWLALCGHNNGPDKVRRRILFTRNKLEMTWYTGKESRMPWETFIMDIKESYDTLERDGQEVHTKSRRCRCCSTKSASPAFCRNHSGWPWIPLRIRIGLIATWMSIVPHCPQSWLTSRLRRPCRLASAETATTGRFHRSDPKGEAMADVTMTAGRPEAVAEEAGMAGVAAVDEDIAEEAVVMITPTLWSMVSISLTPLATSLPTSSTSWNRPTTLSVCITAGRKPTTLIPEMLGAKWTSSMMRGSWHWRPTHGDTRPQWMKPTRRWVQSPMRTGQRQPVQGLDLMPATSVRMVPAPADGQSEAGLEVAAEAGEAEPSPADLSAEDLTESAR